MHYFPYEKAAIVLADGNLFTKKSACNKYDVPSGTYDRWRNRLNNDEKLQAEYRKALDKLTSQWQGETVKALKKGLEVLHIAFDNHPFEKKPENLAEQIAWGKNIDATGRAIKSIGDLAIGTHVLMEDEDEDNR